MEVDDAVPEDPARIAASQLLAQFLIWDKVVTVHMNAINAVDITLQEFCGLKALFDGKVIVCNNKVINPLVQRQEKSIDKNMRLATSHADNAGQANIKFEASLLALGEGRGQEEDFGLSSLWRVNLKSTKLVADSEALLINFVYGDLLAQASKPINKHGKYLVERAILAPLNRDVREINALVTAKLPGVAILSKSIDSPNSEGYDSIPDKCLNKISVASLPEHLITLKIGMPVVITQNLYPAKGVCNGSRMIVIEIGKGHILGRLLSGPFKGQDFMIPKIKLHHKGSMTSALSF
ncbi:hypothetical protein PCANC_28659 [Puccinia coronata f. sp. avenae]|uniref:DNA helicase Pif1-like 2B domain-containing protein n=1 Tax=Puccinia coronata f. sp. avenae TaxID=200324 RepID=A0A2N5RWM0_9BASI|nr:hypothetical protein PCANC_28659 [Puccinia coronata f. sp. avenae]